MKRPSGINFLLILLFITLLQTAWTIFKFVIANEFGLSFAVEAISILMVIFLIYGFFNAKHWSFWLAFFWLGINVIYVVFLNRIFAVIYVPIAILNCIYLFSKKEWFNTKGMQDSHPVADNVFLWLFIAFIIIFGVVSFFVYYR